MADEGRVRAFLAIDLPGELKGGIERIQERLRQQVTGVRWTKAESIHLTLKFFGDVSDEEISALSGVVEKAAADAPPLSLGVGTLGAFPGTQKPRVLWIGMDGDTDALSRLQQGIERGLETCGFKREERSFKPHLTLGRCRDPREVTGLETAMGKKNEYRAGRFTAQGLTLFKSDLKPGGAVYSVLAFFPFGKK